MLSAGFIGNDGYETTVEDHRNLLRATFGGANTRLWPQAFAVSPADPGAGLAVTVAGGYAVLTGTEDPAQGSYFVWAVDPEDLAWVAPSVLPRIDSLILAVADGQYGPVLGDQGPQWIIATGTPSASPVALSDEEIATTWAPPGAWLRVANVAVNPGDTAFIAGDIVMMDAFGTAPAGAVGMKHLIRELAAFWPANGTYIFNTETLIGGGVGAQIHTKQLQKTFVADADRCYEIVATGQADGDPGATVGSTSATVRLRYAVGGSVSSASASFAMDRAITYSDASVSNGGFQVIGYLNDLAPGTYTVGAFITSGAAIDGVRVFAPWQLAIKDIGPAIVEG